MTLRMVVTLTLRMTISSEIQTKVFLDRRKSANAVAARRRVRTDCMTLRTVVTLTPRPTILSAIQPPTLLVTAIVIHGSTE